MSFGLFQFALPIFIVKMSDLKIKLKSRFEKETILKKLIQEQLKRYNQQVIG